MADTTAALARVAELEALVRHLALTYGDAEPVFAGADGRGTIDGVPLATAAGLQALYRQVVGERLPADVALVWVRCTACGQWSCHRDLTDEPAIYLEETGPGR